MIKKYLLIALFFFTQLAYTQSTDSKVENISYCVGFVNAGHVYNYETEVLTEDQLRDAYHISTLALELAVASKGRNHYINNIDYYNLAIEAGFEIVYEEFENETFDWDSQGGLDVCQVQLFEYVAQPPESAFWAGDLEFFRKISRDAADESVDMIMEILENY
tara:strand:+ start:79 stop:564 length:486 start_codon:yes stop_codon:yes gene_type:complete